MLNDTENSILGIESASKMQSRIKDSKEDLRELRRLQEELYASKKEIEELKSTQQILLKQSPLKLAFKQIQDFLALAPMAIYFKNKKLEYTFVNQSFAAWANTSSEELLGFNNTSLSLGSVLDEIEKTEQLVIAEGKAVQNKEIEIQQAEAQMILSTYFFPLKDASGNTDGVMVCWIDLSSKVQYELELNKAQEKAASGINSKKAFLANLSHEIRTPLHGILGSSSLLSNLVQNTEQINLLDNIKNSGKSLLDMVDSMLMLESLDKGEWKLNNEKFNLQSLIRTVTESFSEQAKIKMIDLQSFSAQGLPEFLIGDAEKIKVILNIFLSNAVKFTDKGFVHLFVQVEEQKGEEIGLKFSIKDTGSGIKKELQSEIFTSFTQGDSSSTKGHQGAGIGLTMAQKTAAYLGGSIGFESDQFKGSSFWLSLTLRKLPAADSQTKIFTPAQLPVLLVEDNKINQKIVFFTMKKLGFNVEIAENGVEAIERFQKGQFKIVLMDLQMPIMNGFDATLKIRAFEKVKAQGSSLIIALSANTIKEDVEKCFIVGMNEYISKPFSPDKLIEIIQRHIDIKV